MTGLGVIKLKNNDSKYVYLILAALGFIFLRSGYGKVVGGQFVSTLGETLTKFASKNPNPFYKNFLEQVAIPNSVTFGYLTMLGEVFAGLSLLLLSVYLLFNKKAGRIVYLVLGAGLLVGAFLNATFWLAAGWMSPSTESVNLVMLVVQIIGLAFVTQRVMSPQK